MEIGGGDISEDPFNELCFRAVEYLVNVGLIRAFMLGPAGQQQVPQFVIDNFEEAVRIDLEWFTSRIQQIQAFGEAYD